MASSSYFCDSGPRNRRDLCSDDYINIYLTKIKSDLSTSSSNFNQKFSSRQSSSIGTQQSLVLLKHLCGMGRLPKIVISRKTTSVSIEMITSSDGLFTNTGFLFYALSPSVYFNLMQENSDKGSKPSQQQQQQQRRTSLNSDRSKDDTDEEEDDHDRIETAMRRVERWQVDACDSDMNECTIVVTDESMIKSTGAENINHHSPIGYLFGMNQYQPNGFTLKYILRTKLFNTVAINLEKLEPELLHKSLAFEFKKMLI